MASALGSIRFIMSDRLSSTLILKAVDVVGRPSMTCAKASSASLVARIYRNVHSKVTRQRWDRLDADNLVFMPFSKKVPSKTAIFLRGNRKSSRGKREKLALWGSWDVVFTNYPN